MREQHGLTMEEKPGTRFGNYELVRRIDVGGMGEVYLAHQLSAFGRSVAVKIIRSDLVHDITARARFLREAEVSAHLKHEHILPMYDFGEVNGQLFMATPYIEGGTLATRLREEGALTLVDTRKLFVPLVQAVAYIHRRGVIHRDLKPTNILLDNEDGEIYVRLIDFGIASLQGHSASPPLTTAGHEMGTIAYMAPERLSGIAAPSNDIFSLGVILHQMLTGHISMTSMGGVSNPNARLPEPLMRVVRRSVAVNTTERYASADELLQAFIASYEQVTGTGHLRQNVSPTASLNTVQEVSRPVHEAPERVSRPELISLALSGEVNVHAPASAFPVSSRTAGLDSFTPEDYTAITTSFGPGGVASHGSTGRLPSARPTPRSFKRRSPRDRNKVLVLISSGILLLILLIAIMLYSVYTVLNAPAVAINFAPRVQIVSQVFTLKTNSSTSAVNVSQSSIPAHLFTTQRSEQQVGSTTGQVNCVFHLEFTCQQGVSVSDVNLLLAQIQPDLQKQITQDLQNQINAAGGVPLGQIKFYNQVANSTPTIGQPGRSVTVQLSEQGAITYILRKDATSLTRQLLTKAVAQLGQGYQLLDSTMAIGTPQLHTVDTSSGSATILVPAGVVARYQFTSAQIQEIKKGLAGKTQSTAAVFLRNQPGIDPATIGIHFTNGKGPALPSDVNQINIVPLNPENVPFVSLTPVPTVTSTPTN